MVMVVTERESYMMVLVDLVMVGKNSVWLQTENWGFFDLGGDGCDGANRCGRAVILRAVPSQPSHRVREV